MNTPPSPEQRLEVSRALYLQALRQPAWLLLVQRVCANPTHAPSNAPEPNMAETLLKRCLQSFLDQIDDTPMQHSQHDHAPHDPTQ